MFSVIVGDKVKDIKYKKMGLEFPSYNVFLGDKPIAQLFQSNRKEWTVVVLGETDKFRLVEGFANRRVAVQYALRALGYYKE